MPLSPSLVPIFWGAIIASGISGVGLIAGLTLLLGSQRPIVLRIVWISASALVASLSALALIMTH